jgi:group I intron endonuclease
LPALLYSITHRDTGRRYIGITGGTLARRMQAHDQQVRSGKRRSFVHAAINKYGWNAFDVQVEAQLPTREEAQIAERIAIALERPAFNMTAGGDGVGGPTASATLKKSWASGNRARKASPETRAKMSASHKGKSVSARVRAALNWTGRRHSDEARAKMRATRKGVAYRAAGYTHTAESRAKMSAAHRARWAAKRQENE